MGRGEDREGLSLTYRFVYRIRYTMLHLFGPAQLGGQADPHARLRNERAARVEAGRRARLEREQRR